MSSYEEIKVQIERALNDQPGLISRKQLACILGLSPRTLANCDSAKTGVAHPIRIGQRVVYDKREVIKWIASRAAPTLSEGDN